jgi:hypothetical protein
MTVEYGVADAMRRPCPSVGAQGGFIRGRRRVEFIDRGRAERYAVKGWTCNASMAYEGLANCQYRQMDSFEPTSSHLEWYRSRPYSV